MTTSLENQDQRRCRILSGLLRAQRGTGATRRTGVRSSAGASAGEFGRFGRR